MSLHPRRFRAAIAACTLFAAACSEQGAGPVIPLTPPTVPGQVAAVSCTAQVRSGRVSCDDPGLPAGAHADRIFGGQRVNVLVQSSNVAYDTTTQLFSFDLTVQNLLVQRMGSDGSTVSGVRVLFASGPTTTAGVGSVAVHNADGVETFTASGQPYFYYPGALAPQAVTPVRRWELEVPRSVSTFAFTLYVSTPLVPVIVFEMSPGGNRDIYRMGIDGNDLLKLSTSLLSDGGPTVAAGMVVFTSYRDTSAELYRVPLVGGTETRLTRTRTTNETNAALSPDGTHLAWAQGPSGGITKIYAGDASAAGALAVAGSFADGIQTSPSWRNNSELVFTMANASSADIYQVSLGSLATLLTGTGSAEVEPAWSPDGTRVAFASNRTGDTELYTVDVGSGAVTRITTRTGSDGAPTWLADGRIVFTCVTGTQFHLCLVDPANPAAISTLPTPYQADHAAAVRF